MKDKETKELWYMPALRMFGSISGWIVGPVVLALIVGKYLDRKYDSAPWFFLGLTAVAFFISIFGILRILVRYIKDIEKEIKIKKEKELKEEKKETNE